MTSLTETENKKKQHTNKQTKKNNKTKNKSNHTKKMQWELYNHAISAGYSTNWFYKQPKWDTRCTNAMFLYRKSYVGRVYPEFFSEFQLCIGWGEGELQQNFENAALF